MEADKKPKLPGSLKDKSFAEMPPEVQETAVTGWHNAVAAELAPIYIPELDKAVAAGAKLGDLVVVLTDLNDVHAPQAQKDKGLTVGVRIRRREDWRAEMLEEKRGKPELKYDDILRDLSHGPGIGPSGAGQRFWIVTYAFGMVTLVAGTAVPLAHKGSLEPGAPVMEPVIR